MLKFKACFEYVGKAKVERILKAENAEQAKKVAEGIDPSDVRLLWSARSEEMKLIEVKEIKES